ncbi:hypothetical protein ACQE3E_20495 [Methylomonas sp. MED-D]|uniref:hypothetical protein n=2 Tax=Methylomonas TaxID=416 RepID=UPI0008DB0106|nr:MULTISPECIES: hypothetical protein [unclassified Methylomonas]MDT4332174.1 hypothetical protein [Methylomonas sp. MV1]OHX35799.1 hypothetical protein BJL95_14760 [Methylomonas sp. LWB]
MLLKNREILNPYFSGNDSASNQYKNGMISAISDLSNCLNEREMEDLIKNKLQLFSSSLNEPQYLQSACELVICSYLAKLYKNAFKYELQVNPPKDVDCSFTESGIQFNVEIKCADFSKSNRINEEDGYKIGFLGRNPDVDAVFNDLAGAFQAIPDGKPLIKQQHMDNKLKDYLQSAHGKFSQQLREDHLNVLAICCDTPLDIQKWFGYMYENQGLFTNDSFYEKENYNLVDIVFITNLYHRHYLYRSKDKISNHWLLDKSFNLVFSNPHRLLDKKSSILRFCDIMPNYSHELCKYQVPGDAEDYVKNSIRIPHFVGDELEAKGIFHFQPNSEITAENI